MATLFCTKKYHRYTIENLTAFINKVENGIYSNATVFNNPPFAPTDFVAIKSTYVAAWTAYDLFGTTKRTQYLVSKKQLLDALDLLADYVTARANNDESVILLSGFEPSKYTQLKKLPLQNVPTFSIKRTANAGELSIEIPKLSDDRNVHYYCICSEGKEWIPKSFSEGILQMGSTDHTVYYNFNKSRKKLFKRLKIGTWHYIYVFAANAVNVTPISNPIKIMLV